MRRASALPAPHLKQPVQQYLLTQIVCVMRVWPPDRAVVIYNQFLNIYNQFLGFLLRSLLLSSFAAYHSKTADVVFIKLY